MFFSISFIEQGLLLVAHAEWDPRVSESCELHICSSKEQARKVLESAKEGQQELLRCLADLPETTQENSVHVIGAAASTIGAMIATLLNDGVAIQTLSDKSDLSGFWEPTRPSDPGILVWVDPEVEYHVAIVRCKRQARSVIRGMSDWMGNMRRSPLLAKINKWPIAETSAISIQNIEGKPAELIHWASLYGKMQGAMRRQVN